MNVTLLILPTHHLTSSSVRDVSQFEMRPDDNVLQPHQLVVRVRTADVITSASVCPIGVVVALKKKDDTLKLIVTGQGH